MSANRTAVLSQLDDLLPSLDLNYVQYSKAEFGSAPIQVGMQQSTDNGLIVTFLMLDDALAEKYGHTIQVWMGNCPEDWSPDIADVIEDIREALTFAHEVELA